jgi:hypothetical protein
VLVFYKDDYMMKRVPSSLLLIPLACLLSGCVGMSYHARDPVWGLGFSETRLAPDVWRVMYRGYYIPEAQAGDYAMLRAAEVVRAAGYRYFVVENERSSATVMGSGYGYVYGGSGSAFAAAYSYPETGLLVRGLSEKPAGGGHMIFDAAFVSAEIKRKYKIKG